MGDANESTIEALEAELRIARRDAADAIERAQRAEARNVILRGKDTYDLPAVLERASRLQEEVDELRYERDPRNWPASTRSIKRKAVAANKAREAAESALAAVTAERDTLREALERADRSISYPVCTTIRPEGFDVKTDDDTVRFVAGIIRSALHPQEA